MKLNKNALLIFAKYPEPGKVKTRMYPHLSYGESAELYRAMVEDLFYSLGSDEQNGEYDTIICYAPKGKRAAFKTWFNKPAAAPALLEQKGIDLGEK